MPSNDLYYYLKRVEREAGLTVSSSFPTSATDEQQLTLDAINATLRELNNHFYLTFKQTEYSLTTTAGVASYNLVNSPYSETFWRVHRIAKNGLRRASDDYPLMYIDYGDRDYLQPSLTGNTLPTHYSGYGEDLLLYPAPNGGILKIRYYGLHIGTDDTGATKKLRLSETDDLTMLDDAYEDVLTYGAALKVRRQQKVDEKYFELKKVWEEWRTSLLDMMQPGEESGPEFILPSYNENYLERKIGPFFNTNI